MLVELLVAATVAASPKPAAAAAPRLTTAQISAALEWGKTAQAQYLRATAYLASGGMCAWASTPVMRVAQFAADAAREYRALAPRQVPASLTKLELVVDADPIQRDGMSFIEAKVVVLMPV